MKSKLGLIVFEEFFNENGREPSKEEFMSFGYSRSWYFEVKRNFRKMREEEAKKAINEVLRKQAIVGKI